MRSELDRTISVLQGDGPGERGERDTPQDPADAGTNLSEADRSEAVLNAARSQRTEVANALARIENGTYGTCVDCGKPIPEGRLEARPEAARCVACQGKRDRGRR
jgi:phage/conjugal plasmid C-4 type zinc finger TraR family protein